jgi:hypothetical protein
MCSLEEAFISFDDQNARNKKKKKSRRPLLPPEQEIIDPDRPAQRKMPPAELLRAQSQLREPFEGGEHNEDAMMAAFDSAELGTAAPVSEDAGSFTLEQDWTRLFNDAGAPDWIKERMPRRDAETPIAPVPWMDGAPTLFTTAAAIPTAASYTSNNQSSAPSQLGEMQRRLDSLFAKLDDMELRRSESNHLEIILFVLGGLFVLLVLDMLVKQGTQASIYMALAGGGPSAIATKQLLRAFLQ